MQLKKTYRKLNPDMLFDEIRDLLARHGLSAPDARMQTYSIGSGATQSRVTGPVFTTEKKECGTVHILGSTGNEVRMTITVDDHVVPDDTISSLREDIDFMLGSYEVRW